MGQSEENGAKNKDEGVKMCVKSNIENEPVECTGTVSPLENRGRFRAKSKDRKLVRKRTKISKESAQVRQT